jgi:outer membrane lipoprotein-sorting protein
MVKKIFIGFLSLQLLAAAPKPTLKPTLEEDIKTYQSQMGSPDWLRVEFTQESFKSLRQHTTTTKGRALFQKPNRFRWILEAQGVKEEEHWLFDGGSVSHYFPKQNKAQVYPGATGQAKEIENLVDMILNFQTFDKNYRVESLKKEGQDQIQIQLIPKTPKDDLEKVDVSYHLKNQMIQKITLHQGHKNRTTFLFEKKLGAKPNPKDFELPAGVKKEI